MKSLIPGGAISRPALVLVAGRTAGAAAAFAIPIVLARLFDQAEFGTYKQIFLLFATLFGLAQLGMAESLYFFVPRRPANAGRQVANALVSLSLAGLACLAILFAARGAIAAWFDNPRIADHLPSLGWLLALWLPSAVLEIVLIARRHHAQAAWTYAASDILRTIFFILPAMALWGLAGVMAGATIFAAVRLTVAVIGAWRLFGAGMRLDLSQWKIQLAYALPFALAVGVEVLHVNWHQYAVASRFDATTFAIYAVGCLQIPLVDLIVTSTVNVMMVEMAEDVHARHGRSARALWHETIARLASLIFPLAAFLLVMAHVIITLLYTSSYAASVPIFMLWSLTILASVLVVDGVLRVFAQTRFLLVMNLIHLSFVALLAGPFISRFGLRGAVLVTLLATAVVKTVAVVRISRLMGARLNRALPWDRLGVAALCAALAALPTLWVTRAVTMSPVVTLITGALVYGAAYLSLHYAFDRRERAAVHLPRERPAI